MAQLFSSRSGDKAPSRPPNPHQARQNQPVLGYPDICPTPGNLHRPRPAGASTQGHAEWPRADPILALPLQFPGRGVPDLSGTFRRPL